jgi:uncharacterized PurR-regulated membrane protein YhhQ (DUF165 family)
LTDRYGFWPVGFGLEVTAGTYAAGFALAARDVVQDWAGRAAVVVLIVTGAVLSFVIVDDQRIALASAAAFGLAELLDMGVYTRMRGMGEQGSRRWSAAVATSNGAGALLDTIVFLAVAFGTAAVTWTALAGQLLGKGYVTAAFIAAFAVARARRDSVPRDR